MPTVAEDFTEPLSPRWRQTTPGGGSLLVADSMLRLRLPEARAGQYADAQLDDYTGLARRDYLWRPPLRLEVRARTSHGCSASGEADGTGLRGTWGFGFWNYPFSLTGVPLRPPNAVWFFGAAPPSNMALVPGIPGWGWKAQVVHAERLGALGALLPTAGAVLAARVARREALAAPWLQRLAGASEALLAVDPRQWHTYTLEWRPEAARFWVDGGQVLQVTRPPRGPLGFVAWIDNQYAIATPRGTLRFGTVDCAPQWLDLDRITIEPVECAR